MCWCGGGSVLARYADKRISDMSNVHFYMCGNAVIAGQCYSIHSVNTETARESESEDVRGVSAETKLRCYFCVFPVLFCLHPQERCPSFSFFVVLFFMVKCLYRLVNSLLLLLLIKHSPRLSSFKNYFRKGKRRVKELSPLLSHKLYLNPADNRHSYMVITNWV